MNRSLLHLAFLALVLTLTIAAEAPRAAETRIAIRGGRWMLNDRLTHPGSAAEGLLISVSSAT